MDKLIKVKKEDISIFDSICPDKIKLFHKYEYFIFDQKNNMVCAVTAVISLIEYLRQKEGKKYEKLSVGFLYHNSLLFDNIELVKRHGLKSTSVLNALLKNGTCSEFIHDSNNINSNPSHEAIIESLSRLKHCDIENIEPSIETIKYIIGYCERPIVAVFTIYDPIKFYSYETSYDIITPPFYENQINSNIKHSILLVGYNDVKRVIYFQNSYGKEWGKGGFGRVSYDCISYFDLLYSMDESCIKSSDDELLEIEC